jgi:hypothetical protein
MNRIITIVSLLIALATAQPTLAAKQITITDTNGNQQTIRQGDTITISSRLYGAGRYTVGITADQCVTVVVVSVTGYTPNGHVPLRYGYLDCNGTPVYSSNEPHRVKATAWAQDWSLTPFTVTFRVR